MPVYRKIDQVPFPDFCKMDLCEMIPVTAQVFVSHGTNCMELNIVHSIMYWMPWRRLHTVAKAVPLIPVAKHKFPKGHIFGTRGLVRI